MADLDYRPLEGLVIGVIQFLDDSTTARERLKIASASQTQQSCVVATHVIGEFSSTISESRRNNFREIRESHFGSPLLFPGLNLLPPLTALFTLARLFWPG